MSPAALVIPDSALRLVSTYFDAATVERALVHVRGNRVYLVKPPPWPVVAQVHGDEGHVVTVDYSAGGNHLRGECTCAVGVDCEHAAATAIVVFARERELAAQRAEAARQAVVGEWLADFGRQESGPGAPAAKPAERVVAYVIDARGGELGLTAFQCPRLKQGGLGNGTVLALLGDSQRAAPGWVDVEDLRRLAMLRAVSRAAPQSTRLRLERLHGELLRDLAGSGHLYWESARTPPLGYGPRLEDSLRWQPAAEDPSSFRLGLGDDSPLVIVPARECHYIDRVAATIGPLDLGVPAELVQRLMTGPPVPASMRATVERSLRPLMTRAAGPMWSHSDRALPAGAAETQLAELERMRPRLVASLDEDPGRRHAIRFVAEACYGEDRFPLAEWDPTRPVDRDLVAEGRCHARLAGLLAQLPHGAGAASSLELLADARHVAQTVVPALRAEGWDCVLDESFPHDAPLVDVAWIEQLKPLSDSHAWFALELGVTIAGRTVPLLPILLRAIREGQLVVETGSEAAHVGSGFNLRLPDGELVHVPAERMQRWLRPLVELELSGLDKRGELVVPAFVAAEIARAQPGHFATAAAALAPARERLEALLELEPRLESPSFGGTLRPYQRLGLAWLHVLHDAGYGGLLADEMGLGKTVQVLAFLDQLHQAGQLSAAAPALIVAPRSVVGNWEAEAVRFTPALRPTVHLGEGRAQGADELRRAPLVVTSYQTLLRDLPLFRELRWTSVMFDEAQALKNPETQLRSAAASLVAQSRFCITGTPIENHLGELWSQIDLAMPGVLGRRRAFESFFRRPIEKFGAVPQLEILRQRMRPFLLRRTKETVELELPPKTEITETIDLDTAQRDLYESLRLKLDERVHKALAAEGIAGSSMVILDALLKLRQCCCDPRLVNLAEARRVTGSAKLERLMDMLVELDGSERSTLVFSQFTSMLDLIEEACVREGVKTVKLTGATRDREAAIRRFQDGEARVFLISLKAGGVGLNLTRADTVIHYDPWWNPAAEAQAAGRAHRIGQEKPVMVYKLVARGTLEEAICKLQGEKRQLTEAALRDGGVTHLAPEDLSELYRRIV